MTRVTDPPAPPRIDVHVHLAGIGTQNSGCWISPAFRKRPTFLGLRLLYGITARQMESTIDQDWAAYISILVEESDLDVAAVLGFDGVYDSRGHLDQRRSQLIVPQSWVFEVCRRFGNLIPAPSINPYRRDALDQLEDAIEHGATLIKWLPIVQGFDPASPRIARFLLRTAEAGIPLLVHAGSGEVTFRTIDPSVGGLERLVPALELGVKVICAHAAAPIHYSPAPSQLPLLRSLLERYPNLWVDNSGLANLSRWMHLPQFATDSLIRDRSLHGSDFPVPGSAFFYLAQLGVRKLVGVQRAGGALQKEIALKRAIGFPEAALTRPAQVLANVRRWYPW